MTEQHFQVFELTDPKSAERRALFEQVQGFCKTKSSRVSPDFYRRLKLLHFTGTLQLQPDGGEGMTPSHAPMCLCMCSPAVDEDVFLGYFRDFGSRHSFGTVLELITSHIRLGALIQFPLLLERWQCMARIVFVEDDVIEPYMTTLLAAVFWQLAYEGKSAYSLVPEIFINIERVFKLGQINSYHEDFINRATKNLKALWSGEAEAVGAYEDEWFVQFSKRFFAKDLASDFQALCEDVYQSIPLDQRVTFDGKRLLLPAA